MKNFRQPGESVDVTIVDSNGCKSGDLLVFGSLIGVAAKDGFALDSVAISVEGVYELPKVTTDQVTVGERLYWDAAQKKLTITPGAGAKPLVGVAIKAAANGATTVECLLTLAGNTGPA